MKNFKKLFRSNYDTMQSACAQIHANHYSCSMEHILEMVNELKKDFPELTDKDIQVQKYGGKRVKGITFVEAFFDRKMSVPIGYEEIKEIEYIK